ncbi:reverse transcriptase domain-containing protein [Tanacetum coccineum]
MEENTSGMEATGSKEKIFFDRRGDFKNQQRSERRRDNFTLLTKSPKEILALDKGKFKALPPMTTLVRKRNNNKFCKFHGEVEHNTDECMHLKRQIEELIKNVKLLHVIKELKQVSRPKITQSFSPSLEISFPPLGDEDGAEGPMIIKADIEGHFIHRIYVDGGSASEILYEHFFNRLRPKVKTQMVPATAPLIGLSREIIWPMGQILLPIKIGDAEHFTSTWMNFMIVRLPYSYNRIIGRPGAAEERIKVAIHPEYPEQTIAIGSILTEEGRKALCNLLRRSLEIFAWKPTDMKGVPRHIAEHRLNVHEGCSPFRQKKRSQNAGATYQRLVDKAFQKQIGRNLEVYVDDLVIKSRTEHETLRDIEETFKTLREINMKLNPKKCTFGIEEGMFLGYKVNTEGIMVCPDKVGTVLSLSLKYLKDVRKLNGKLASLSRFLSKSAEKSLPFFKTLKKCTKKSDFQWIAKAEAAFKEMKKLIVELPTLTAPMEKKELIVYLAAAREAVNAVLMMEREAKQMPVYFVNRALQVERQEDDHLDTPMEAEEELPDPWTLFPDRSSCVDSFEAALILTNLEGA